MIKMLMFLKQSADEDVRNHFYNFTLRYLEEIGGKNFTKGSVTSSLLLENKYTHYCEISADSKEEMDRLLSSEAGKKLNKDLADLHKDIDIIFIKTEETE